MYILWKYIAFQVFFLLFNIIGGVLKFHFSIQAHYFRIKIISDYKRNVYIKKHRVHLYVMYLYTTRASMCSHLLEYLLDVRYGDMHFCVSFNNSIASLGNLFMSFDKKYHSVYFYPSPYYLI